MSLQNNQESLLHFLNESEPIVKPTQRNIGSMGELIKTARLQQGITVAFIANRLKIAASKIEALEKNDLHLVGDVVFTRALVRSICKIVKADTDLVLGLLPNLTPPSVDPIKSEEFPLKRQSIPSDQLRSKWIYILDCMNAWPLSWIILTVLCVAVVASAWWYWQIEELRPTTDGIVENVADPSMTSEPPRSSTPSAPVVSSEALVVSENLPLEAASSRVLLATASATTTASTPMEMGPKIESESTPITPMNSARIGLQFWATADSWIQLTDEKGQIIYSGLLQAGQNQQLQASPMSKLVIGNAAGIRLEQNGVAMDVSTLAKNNVVRLELK